ncbi:hypothetical protein CNR22_08445 [Sphingobacteriaceae bacterium]|nr:hypothetical protein CNR22_08445 [Sphingobacteriaceae bacterium]
MKKTVFSVFTQDHNNCVPIALIKAAVDKFGLYGVFKKVHYQNNSIRVLMRNNRSITIANQEYSKIIEGSFIKWLIKAADIKPATVAMMNQVLLLYAVMIKCGTKIGFIYENGEVESMTLKESLYCITKEGLCADHAHRYLGLKRKKIEDFDKNSIGKIPAKGVLAYNEHHTVAVRNRCFDHYGSLSSLKKDPNDEALCWYYQLI